MVLADVLDWHRLRYPRLGAADVYKLLHQGVFGPGHLVRDPAAAYEGLLREMAGLEGSPPADISATEPEPLDPDGRLVRVNLRPLLGKPERADVLARALVESAAAVIGDPRLMAGRLAAAVEWCRGSLCQLAAPLEDLAFRARVTAYPALHHSRDYQSSYRPAYRVVLADRWPE
ncbi:hypothetical protein FJY71_03235 [candidate division WOR-3 bacterium]|nr:hypothetical protein [candidate division WOR-3 bacterium]